MRTRSGEKLHPLPEQAPKVGAGLVSFAFALAVWTVGKEAGGTEFRVFSSVGYKLVIKLLLSQLESVLRGILPALTLPRRDIYRTPNRFAP